jgi:hypothetical protein
MSAPAGITRSPFSVPNGNNWSSGILAFASDSKNESKKAAINGDIVTTWKILDTVITQILRHGVVFLQESAWMGVIFERGFSEILEK